MKNIQNAITDFNKKYGRNLKYNSTEEIIVEVISGNECQIDFKQKKPDRGKVISLYSEPAKWSLEEYGVKIPNVNQILIELLILHVDALVHKELVEEGVMVEDNGEFYPLGLGVCHAVWGRKKSYLRKKYGICWKSPQDEDPTVSFD